MLKQFVCAPVLNLALILCTSCSIATERKQERGLHSAIPGARKHAVFSLGREGDKSAIPGLINALKDPDASVRSEAGKALGAIRDRRAVPALVKALRDKDMNVRMYAAYALGEIKDPRAADSLLEALHDPEWCVRDQASWALRELHDPEISDKLLLELKEKKTDEKQVRWILGQTDNKGPAAYWNFEDRSTLIAKDVTENGSDGQVNGCTSCKGKFGFALKFKNQSFISLGKPPGILIAGQPLSITAWIKPDAPSGVVIARGGAWCGFCLYLKDGVAKFGIHRERDGPSYIAVGKEITTGNWVNLAGVIKENRIEIYVNGKLSGSAKTPGFIPQECGQGMEIGCDSGTTSAEITDYFDGIIDEVKVYNKSLTKEEIEKQYNKEA